MGGELVLSLAGAQMYAKNRVQCAAVLGKGHIKLKVDMALLARLSITVCYIALGSCCSYNEYITAI